VSRKRWKRYEVSGLFALGYGTFRFMVEFVREPDPLPHLQGGLFEWVTMGQVLCIPLIITGAVLLWFSSRQPKAA
jgi:phosphatidylglycerol:prolipoprotein diacylglycerol transferase